MSSDRRNFIKKGDSRSSRHGSWRIRHGNVRPGVMAGSLGANDRINIGIAGLGRRLGAFIPPIAEKKNNVELLYLCDVMKSQREQLQVFFQSTLKIIRNWRMIFVRSLPIRRWMCLLMPLPTTGMPRGQLWLWPEASMCTWKSLARITCRKMNVL